MKPTQQLHAIKQSNFYDDVIVPGSTSKKKNSRFWKTGRGRACPTLGSLGAPDRRVKMRGFFCRRVSVAKRRVARVAEPLQSSSNRSR